MALSIVHLLPSPRVPIWVRYLATTAIVLIAFGAGRLLVEAAGDRFPFLLLFPAIIVCAGLFDRGSGILAVILSTMLAVFLLEPTGQGIIAGGSEIAALLLFLVIGLLMATVVEELRKAVEARSTSLEELRRANERLTGGEQEKAMLLEELTHRTQNNLQSIASMLNLQAHAAPEPELRDGLMSAAHRVQVVGLVHSRLSHMDGHVAVDGCAFIRDLCRELQSSLIDGRAVRLEVDLDAGSDSQPIPLTRAVPMGLAVNELVTNALRHAFPDGRAGTVTVRLHRRDSEFLLEVDDDGIGMPDGRPHRGLGQRLVRALAAQGGGGLEIAPATPGTSCTVRFPDGANAA